ncbi:phosphoribosylaminoimidazolesuccinocarboxamide synthase [Periweissella beninensis]|uniref:phosphoribosylaminoimidazolesuccinocarboxamide synthase n=1 Tax=Periweissella beninensis TaxID=504936 RepID=UPI0021A7239D|nr:phosphoribosylaminoimidazolesuccinocarboxamide synthase [Periweissella beninensis]MCT4395538.1 phosphoribosylaminoimidazolesuccinocarboxamide synthase [Periweissella beninensis]
MEKQTLLYEGKAKQVYSTNEPNILWVHFMDQVTALNGKRKTQIAQKGQLASAISDYLFNYLTDKGIANHYLKKVGPVDQLVKKVKILPLEVVVRNLAAGHFVTKYGVPMHQKLTATIHEFYLKNDELDDPFMNDEQIMALNLATKAEIATLKAQADLVNQYLTTLFKEINIELVDFKLEFGYDETQTLILADELSPDNMRLLDMTTHASLDKDVFRQQSGDMTSGYQIVLDRLINRK